MIAFNKHRPLPIGLHLGNRSATLVQLADVSGQREVHALAQGELSHDDNASPEDQDRLTAAVLEKLITDHRFKGREVITSFGSDDLFVQNVRIPQLPPEEVEKVVNWEAEERLPYPIAEAEIRYIPAGQVRQEDTVKQEIILLGCHQGIIDRHIGVLEQAGLTPLAIDVEPCAILRCLQHCSGHSETVTRRAYLDLGENATMVLFTEGDQIVFLKYISIGGTHLDQAVARHLNLSLDEAARMRSAVTSSSELDASDEVHRSVIEAIRTPLETMSGEIELCLRYYKVTFRGKMLDKVILSGNESSQWLAEFLAQRVGTACEIANPFESLAKLPATPSAIDRPWRWTTAMGLSMKTHSA